MDGLFLNKALLKQAPDVGYQLIAQQRNVQVMLQSFPAQYKMYIAPCSSQEAMEFFYVMEGKLMFKDGDEDILLEAGDSFYTLALTDNVVVDVLEDTKALYFTTEETYDNLKKVFEQVKDIIDKIDEKDQYTKGHSERVGIYTATLVQHCEEKIDSIEDIIYAAQLHDVGKCMIPDEILLKPGRFTEEERNEMNQHAKYTYKMLKDEFGLSEQVCHIAACHHERYDGSGYPYGLKGEEIPIESRMIAIADTFDAITTTRPYQKARSFEEAVTEMEKFSSQYDPKLFEVFKRIIRENIIKPHQMNEA